MRTPSEDEVIAFAICIYEARGYAPSTFEMLNYEDLRRFVLEAEHLINAGYSRKQDLDEGAVKKTIKEYFSDNLTEDHEGLAKAICAKFGSAELRS